MKKAFKIIGICLASIIGLVGIAVAVIAIKNGGFGNKKVQITSFSFEESSMLVVDDFSANLTYEPQDATALKVKLTVDKGAEVVEVPDTVEAGTPFKIKLKKDANGNNVGGEVLIKATYDGLLGSSNELKVLVDVAIPNNGLKMWSNYDSVVMANQKEPVFLYVFTDPSSALSPNNGEVPDLAKNYKNITLTSSNSDSLEIIGEGIQTEEVIEGYGKNKIPVIKYEIQPKTKSDGIIYLHAKALRTYFMQDDYVDQADYTDNAEYYSALSAYLEKYKQYIINDPRQYKNEQGTVIFENGEAFINSTLNNGVVDIKPNDNTETKINAANFYMFVDITKAYSVVSVSVKELQLTAEGLEMNLHDDVWEFDKDELKNFFGIHIIQSDGSDEEAVKAKFNELKIMPIRNNYDDADGLPNYDMANDIFEVQNPTNLATPVWRIRAINPILNFQDGTRLRFYLEEKDDENLDENGQPTIKIIYADIAVNVINHEISELTLNPLAVNSLCLNKNGGLNGETNTTILNNQSYIIKGVNPTYTTVKFFVTKNSATTAGGAYFKLKLEKDGSKPISLNMPVMKLSTETPETVQAYEIKNNNGINTILEALNVTANEPVEIFAAVIKTDYNGNPILGDDGKTYTIVKKSNTVTLNVVNYLEKLNIYTVLEKQDADNNITRSFYKRNVGSYVAPERTPGLTDEEWANFVEEEKRKFETVKLLSNENYKFYLTNLELTESGAFDSSNELYKNKDIDYRTNLAYALSNVMDSDNLMVGAESSDGVEYVALNRSAGKPTEENINGIDFVVVDLQTIRATSNNLPNFYADFKNADASQTIKEYSQTKLNISFANITSGNILTSVSDTTSDYIEINAVASTGTINWIANGKDFHLGKVAGSPDVNSYFEMELDIAASVHDDVNNKNDYISDKLDFSYNTEDNVLAYVANVKNKNNMRYNWAVREQDKEYVNVDTDNNGLPILSILKGTKTGADVELTVLVEYYPIDGKVDEFYKSFSKTLHLKIILNDINYSSYTPIEVELGGKKVNALIDNNVKALELYGGDSFNLFQQLSTPTTIVRQKTSTEYEDTGKTSQRYIKIMLGEANDIIKEWTFKIMPSNGEYLAYFKNADNSKSYITKPTTDNNLEIFAEDISEESEVVLEMTSDLLGTENKFTYNIIIKPSIAVVSPVDENNRPINLITSYNSIIDNTGTGTPIVGDNTINLALKVNENSQTIYKRYGATRRVIEEKNATTNETISKNTLLPVGFEIHADSQGYAKLNTKENEFVIGNNSGDIVGNKVYVYGSDGTSISSETLNFVLQPYQVAETRNVKIKMYYYIPKIKNIIQNKVGNTIKYTYEYETYTDGGIDTHKYVFEKVYVKEFVVIVNNHVNVALSSSVTDENPISIKSGAENYNIFDEYAKNANTLINGTTNFIDITYNTGATSGTHIDYYDAVNHKNHYIDYLRLQIDYSSLDEDNGTSSGIDNRIKFANLFGGNAISDEIVQQNIAKFANGDVITSSVNFDLTVRVNVQFKEKETPETSAAKALVSLFQFKVKFTKSVAFEIGDDTYSTSTIPGTDIIIGGHEYQNNIEEAGVITLKNSAVTLFDSTLGVKDNIVKIVGGGAHENLTVNNISEIKLYKFNLKTNAYEQIFDDLFVNESNLNQKLYLNWVKNEDGTTSKIQLILIRSVNENEQYKVEFISNSFGLSGNYYFAVKPTYVAVSNYPIENTFEKVIQGSQINLATNYINPNNRITIKNSESNALYSLITKAESGKNVSYLVENIIDALGNITYGAEIKLTNNLADENLTLWNYKVVSGAEYASVDSKTGIVNFNINATNDIKNVTVRAYMFNGAYVDYEFHVYKSISQYAAVVKNGESSITPENPLVIYTNREFNLLDYVTLKNSSGEIVNNELIIKYEVNSETPILNYKVGATYTNQVAKSTVINNTNSYLKFEDVSKIYSNIKFYIYTTNSVGNSSPLSIIYVQLMPNFELTQNVSVTPVGAGNALTFLSQDAANPIGKSTDILQITEQSDRNYKLQLKFKNVIYAGGAAPNSSILSNINLKLNDNGVSADKIINASNMAETIIIDYNTLVNNSFKVDFVSGNIDKDILITFELIKTFTINGKEEVYSVEKQITLKPNISINLNYAHGKNYKEIEASSIKEGQRSFTVVSDQNVQVKDYKGNAITDAHTITYILKDASGNILASDAIYDLKNPINSFGIDNGTITYTQVNKETTFQVVIKTTWSDNLTAAYEATYIIHFMPNIKIPTGTGGVADKSLMVKYTQNNNPISDGVFPVYAGSSITLNFDDVLNFATQSSNKISLDVAQNSISGTSNAKAVLFETIADINNATGPYKITPVNENQGKITFGGVVSGQSNIVSIPLYLDLKGNYNGVIKPDINPETGNYVSPSLMDLYNELGLVLKFKITNSVSSIAYATGKNEKSEINMKSIIENGTSLASGLERNQVKLISTEYFIFNPIQKDGVDLVTFNKANETATITYVDIDEVINLFDVSFVLINNEGVETDQDASKYVDYDKNTGVVTVKPYTNNLSIMAKVSLSTNPSVIIKYQITIPNNGLVEYAVSNSQTGEIVGNSNGDNAIEINSDNPTGIDLSDKIIYLYVTQKEVSDAVTGDKNIDATNSLTGITTVTRIVGDKKYIYKGYKLGTKTFKYTIDVLDGTANIVGTTFIPSKFYATAENQEREVSLKIEVLPTYSSIPMYIKINPIKVDFTVDIESTLSMNINGLGNNGYYIKPSMKVGANELSDVAYTYAVDSSLSNYLYVDTATNKAYIVDLSQTVCEFVTINLKVTGTIEGKYLFTESINKEMAPKVFFKTSSISVSPDVKNVIDIDMITIDGGANNSSTSSTPILVSGLEKGVYSIIVSAKNFTLSDYFDFATDVTSVKIEMNDASAVSNEIWKLKNINIERDNVLTFVAKLTNEKDSFNYFEKEFSITLTKNSGILNLQENYSYTNVYNPTNNEDVPEELEYVIDLGENFDVIGGERVELSITGTASNSSVINTYLSVNPFDFNNKRYVTVNLNNTAKGTDGNPIKLASLRLNFALYNTSSLVSTAVTDIQFNWLALTNKTTVYSKEVLVPNNESNINLSVNTETPEGLNGGNYQIGIFDASQEIDYNNIVSAGNKITDFSNYVTKFYSGNTQITPVNVMENGITKQSPRLEMDENGRVTLIVNYHNNNYLKPDKIEFYVIAKQTKTDLNIQQIWSVKKQITINVNYIELLNFENNLSREFIYSKEVPSVSIIGMPESPFVLQYGTIGNYEVSYSIAETSFISGTNNIKDYLSLSQSTVVYPADGTGTNVKVLLLNINNIVGASGLNLEWIKIKAVVTKNGNLVGELLSIVNFIPREIVIKSDTEKHALSSEFGKENVEYNSDLDTLEIDLDAKLENALNSNYKIDVLDNNDTSVSNISYSVEVLNVVSNSTSLNTTSVKFKVNENGKLILEVQSNKTGATSVLYQPSSINIKLNVMEKGIVIYSYNIHVGIVWQN